MSTIEQTIQGLLNPPEESEGRVLPEDQRSTIANRLSLLVDDIDEGLEQD
ncbi:hypothetical protein HZB78_03135 [Candidatus Collierbacteria bacterium]|nr:hypothetical protein [Candidatus Collierbacteria bacterium]